MLKLKLIFLLDIYERLSVEEDRNEENKRRREKKERKRTPPSGKLIFLGFSESILAITSSLLRVRIRVIYQWKGNLILYNFVVLIRS